MRARSLFPQAPAGIAQQMPANARARALLPRGSLSAVTPSHAQPQLLDTLYWFKQLVALALGVAAGLIPLVGFQYFLG